MSAGVNEYFVYVTGDRVRIGFTGDGGPTVIEMPASKAHKLFTRGAAITRPHARSIFGMAWRAISARHASRPIG